MSEYEKTIEEIQKGSIQVVGRIGSKFKLQCLSADVENLPKTGIASGSVCVVLDAEKNNMLVFNHADIKMDGSWYPVNIGTGAGANELFYDSDGRFVE